MAAHSSALSRNRDFLTAILDAFGSYLVYAALLLFANAVIAAPATNVDNEYKDAQKLFERRDLQSRQKAIEILEKNLEASPGHLETQALIGFAYAHEANLMVQLGERGGDYLTSAEAFAKGVIAKQPTNIYARKTVILLHLVGGLQIDASKILAKDMTDKETDADLWYMQAVMSDGDKALRSLTRALELKPDHVWIYSDMAFRALQMNNIPVAEKWVAALDARAPGIADVDLLRAIIAAQKKDRKQLTAHWNTFSKKVPGSPMLLRIMNKMNKTSSSP